MDAAARGITQADNSTHANSGNILNENRGRSTQNNQNTFRKGHWSVEEDIRLIQFVRKYGEGRWSKLAKAAGLQRCGKSCRLRWVNYLRPDIKRGHISEEEERLIIELHSLIGNRWSLIAMNLPGRSDNEIKNYWRSHIKKKLRSMDGGDVGGDGGHMDSNNIIFGSSSNEYEYVDKSCGVDDDSLNYNSFNKVGTTSADMTSYFEDAYHHYDDEYLLQQEANMPSNHSMLVTSEDYSYSNIKIEANPNCINNSQAPSNYITQAIPFYNSTFSSYDLQPKSTHNVTMPTTFDKDDNTSGMMNSSYMQLSCNEEHQMLPILCKTMSKEDLACPLSFMSSRDPNDGDESDGDYHINTTTNEQWHMCNEEYITLEHDIKSIPPHQQEVVSTIDESLQWDVDAIQPIVEMEHPSSPIIDHNFAFELWGGTPFHVGNTI